MPKVPTHFTKPTFKAHTLAILDADQQCQWLRITLLYPTSPARAKSMMRTTPTTITRCPQVQMALLPVPWDLMARKVLAQPLQAVRLGDMLAHKLATAGAAVLGAVGMNMVSHKLKRNNSQQPAQTVTIIPVAATPAFSATTVRRRTTISVDASVWAQVWV